MWSLHHRVYLIGWYIGSWELYIVWFPQLKEQRGHVSALIRAEIHHCSLEQNQGLSSRPKRQVPPRCRFTSLLSRLPEQTCGTYERQTAAEAARINRFYTNCWQFPKISTSECSINLGDAHHFDGSWYVHQQQSSIILLEVCCFQEFKDILLK